MDAANSSQARHNLTLRLTLPPLILLLLFTSFISIYILTPSLHLILDTYCTLLTPRLSVVGVLLAVGVVLPQLLGVVDLNVRLGSLMEVSGGKFGVANVAAAGYMLALTFGLWTVALALAVFQAVVLLVLLVLLFELRLKRATFHPVQWATNHLPAGVWFALILHLALGHAVLLSLGHLSNREDRLDLFLPEVLVYLVGSNIVGYIMVFVRSDAIHASTALAALLSIFAKQPKPLSQNSLLLVFAALYPIVWLSSLLWGRLSRGRSGEIVLLENAVDDNEDEGPSVVPVQRRHGQVKSAAVEQVPPVESPLEVLPVEEPVVVDIT